MESFEVESPKVFISYSWSSREHEERVLNLATALRENGVDAILDKWDLKPGDDAIAFMEQMVTSDKVKKVIIVSDCTYAKKADERKGGVGTETQIISAEIYNKVQQDKFVAVVFEKDENGKPCLPTYYKSRIYIDLSEPDTYSENFERLIRWIYDKPVYEKPKLGSTPSFLSEGASLWTTYAFNRTIEAIKNSKPYAERALTEYLDILVQNLEKFRIKNVEGNFDDAVIKNIEEFTPYRNEIISLFLNIAIYYPEKKVFELLHRFFESLIPYMFSQETTSFNYDMDFDNFRFIIHELFLYAVAIFLKSELFEQTSVLLNQRYYVPLFSNYGKEVMRPFYELWQTTRSLENRNERLGLKLSSLMAYMLKERNRTTSLDFKYLMQADFVLFICAELQTKDKRFIRWWPETLAYLESYSRPFEIFARAESRQYFDKIKCLFNIKSPEDFKPLLEEYQKGDRQLPRWQFDTLNPAVLMNFEKLATMP